MSKMEQGRDGARSPYVISQIPSPPRQSRPRSERSSPRRSARMSASPTYKEKKTGGVRVGSHIICALIMFPIYKASLGSTLETRS